MSQSPVKILLVEDHADTLDMLALFLRRAGHDVRTAACCADARPVASAWRPDLVIGDVGLPDGDGAALLSELKSACGCRVIALTGFGMPDEVDRIRAAGVDHHLLKPMDVLLLGRVIGDLCPG